VLIVAVQNGVERGRLGVAMATTSFFRALGGAVGAAVLGAVFAARTAATGAGGARVEVIDAVQTVFALGAALAGLGLLFVLMLEEVPLRGGRAPEPAVRHARA
jgi:hypothetical protein